MPIPDSIKINDVRDPEEVTKATVEAVSKSIPLMEQGDRIIVTKPDIPGGSTYTVTLDHPEPEDVKYGGSL
jgi:hypothetical protein